MSNKIIYISITKQQATSNSSKQNNTIQYKAKQNKTKQNKNLTTKINKASVKFQQSIKSITNK